MTRLSRLVFATALLGAAACSSPTAPSAPKKLLPDGKPLMSECINGWQVQNGVRKPCG
jgi:hypothetical protein